MFFLNDVFEGTGNKFSLLSDAKRVTTHRVHLYLTARGRHGIIRSYLKKVFWPNLGVEPSFQVLDIPEYACGLKLGLALILNQNPIFEMASTLKLALIRGQFILFEPLQS